MRSSRVVVRRRRVIDASADKVWSLLSSPEAWSLNPASFALDLFPPGAGRLRLAITLRRGLPACLLYEVGDDVAGQVMSLSMLPSGQEKLRLSAEPSGHGTRATVTVTSLPGRYAVTAEIEAYWQVRLEHWLANLDAVLQSSRPWPGAALDPGLNAACHRREPLISPAEVSASTLIDAPVGEVWDVIHAPGSHVLADPRHFVCAGHIPGTPVGQPGEMQYFVTRDDQGSLRSTAIVVTELNDQHSAMTAVIAPWRIDTLHEVMSTPRGTQVTLTCRWPARRRGQAAERRQVGDSLQANLSRYKMLIENAAPGPFPASPGGPMRPA